MNKKLYTVINCPGADEDGVRHTLRNAEIAFSNKADGIFLTSSIDCFRMVDIYREVRDSFSDAWIGIRFEDVDPIHQLPRLRAMANKCKQLDAVWTRKLPEERPDTQATIFGSFLIDYKGSNEVRPPDEKDKPVPGEALRALCNRISSTVDVAVVFGPERGTSPGMAATAALRKFLGSSTQLAIAGGVSAENLHKFIRSADIFIVGTSLSEQDENGYYRLVPGKVAQLAQKIHA